MDQVAVTDLLVLSSYPEVKEILTSDAFQQASKAESHDFVGATVLTMDGNEHFARRRLLSHLMRRATLERFERDVLDPTIDRCLAAARAQGAVDLVRLGRTIFLQLAAATIGLDGITTQEDTDNLAGYLYPLIEGTTVEWSTRDHAEVIAEGIVAKEAYRDTLLRPAMERRRALVRQAIEDGDEAAEAVPVDLLTLMLGHAEQDEDAVVREAVLFLVASTLNNAGTITHAVDEVHRWLADHPQDRGLLTEDGFLEQVVHETLRVRQITPALIRRATRRIVLGSGREVQAGETFALNVGSANHDPTVWGADADRFNPHRSVPAGEKPYGLAFGTGVHVCLGRPLVLGTYTDASGAGMVVRLLRRLFEAGVRPDPARPATRASSRQDRFETYPVLLDSGESGQ
jgi:cytochrome P450